MCLLPVLAIVDQAVDDTGIGQGGGVAQIGEIVFGDFAQDAAHDLAGSGFGRPCDHCSQSGLAIGPISLRTHATSSFCNSSLGSSPLFSVT